MLHVMLCASYHVSIISYLRGQTCNQIDKCWYNLNAFAKPWRQTRTQETWIMFHVSWGFCRMLDVMLRVMLGVMLHVSYHKSSTSRFMPRVMLDVLLLVWFCASWHASCLLHVSSFMACFVLHVSCFIFHVSCHASCHVASCHVLRHAWCFISCVFHVFSCKSVDKSW